MKNYYEILGVAQTSDAETITAAFKALMQKLDSGTDSATAAKGNTKEFNDVYAVLKAHEVLIDPDARREYDASLAKAKPQDVPPPTPKIPAVVEEEDVFVYPSANAFTEQQPSRWNTKIWLLPVLLLGFFLIYQIIQGQNSADPNAIVTVTVTGTANVRDAPTSSGSTVLGEYPPGTTLRGRWVPGNLDPSERWLELQEGGRFVWGRNLREVEASPKISQNAGDAPDSLPRTSNQIDIARHLFLKGDDICSEKFFNIIKYHIRDESIDYIGQFNGSKTQYNSFYENGNQWELWKIKNSKFLDVELIGIYTIKTEYHYLYWGLIFNGNAKNILDKLKTKMDNLPTEVGEFPHQLDPGGISFENDTNKTLKLPGYTLSCYFTG